MPNTVNSGSGGAPIEGPCHHRAPAWLTAGCFGVVVGKNRWHVELHAGLCSEKLDRLRAMGKKGVDTSRIEMRRGLVLQVGSRRPGRFVYALLGSEARAGNPQPSARARGGTAVEGFFLDHEHAQTLPGSGDGGRHA
jgi:hypothetical protein